MRPPQTKNLINGHVITLTDISGSKGVLTSPGGGGGALPIMTYTGRHFPKEVHFPGVRYVKGVGNSRIEV